MINRHHHHKIHKAKLRLRSFGSKVGRSGRVPSPWDPCSTEGRGSLIDGQERESGKCGGLAGMNVKDIKFTPFLKGILGACQKV